VDKVNTSILRKYQMNDLGEMHLILGCEVKYDRCQEITHLISVIMSYFCVRNFYRWEVP